MSDDLEYGIEKAAMHRDIQDFSMMLRQARKMSKIIHESEKEYTSPKERRAFKAGVNSVFEAISSIQ